MRYDAMPEGDMGLATSDTRSLANRGCWGRSGWLRRPHWVQSSSCVYRLTAVQFVIQGGGVCDLVAYSLVD